MPPLSAAFRLNLALCHRVVFRDQLADARDQRLSVLHRVGTRVVAADQQPCGAELVIFEQRLGDGFRAADQRRRISLCPGRRGERRP